MCAFTPNLHAATLLHLAGDDIVIGKTSPIPDDGSGMPQRYSKKVRSWVGEVIHQAGHRQLGRNEQPVPPCSTAHLPAP